MSKETLAERLGRLFDHLVEEVVEERTADSRGDDFFGAMQEARRQVRERDERVQQLETDLRIAKQEANRLQKAAKELLGRLNEYETGLPMQIGPGYQALVDRLQAYVDDTGPVDLLELLSNVKELLGAVRSLDSISRHRYGRIERLQASLDAEKIRADTAERLMREARAAEQRAATALSRIYDISRREQDDA
jgi:uncharacterized protein (DUF3084 family)